jgi:predicted kinase
VEIKMRVLRFNQFIEEGVNDPSIFKAVFLAGGPGSGKSFIVGKTALTALGFKVINSDISFENALRKVGLKPIPQNIFSPLGQELRGKAKNITAKQQQLAINGRLGLVIDGTGKDYEKINKQADMLRNIGYDVAMIFVNTDLDTALVRNRMRDRSLPDAEVESMWKDVQKNIGKFQNFFRQKMYIVDNSAGSNYEGAVLSTYKKISAWSKTKPDSSAANEWIKSQRKVNEELMLEADHCPVFTVSQMKLFEKFVDRMFKEFDVNFEFTKHFHERMSDDRNEPCIDLKELAGMIQKIYKKYQKGEKSLSNFVNTEAVIKDIQTDLNMPIVVEYNRKNDELVVTSKTIMRKKNFRTPNSELRV